ncbi:hypothetical protein HMPREF9713_01735 [Myroides odoratimimus CCUG 12700]|uniref:hypothetical protein n=1 Tax=Myroides odoratimimus TaxID=76832 RepID=UPI000353B4D0|nr:hypothetical protein [Myroides odoratimimus]EPH11250.1 hypothetical protein HMPREF9713_01735 [Myroides odoratimimus CCUG 12700]
MTISERILAIAESKPTGEKKSLRFKNENKIYDVKEIPLTALLYNPYNGRIGSMIQSFESSKKRKINNEDPDDIKVIEQYLYDSASARNQKTIESLKEIGQQEVGIVTKDGVIIDGNRRACMLNILNRKGHNINTFKAIVLDSELKDNKKDITLLETRYQMGVDSKVDYNPIEKYIRCSDLLNEHGFTIQEIADLMAETEGIINEWLSRFSLMEDYLTYLKTPKVYTRLEKREGHFVDLKNYLNNYNQKKNKSWEYDESDVEDLKNSYFDYIRLGVPVQRARVIAKPTTGNSFFTSKTIWDEFITEHNKLKEKVIEKSFDDLNKKFPDYSNEDIIQIIDENWINEIKDSLIENLSFNEITLKEINESFLPLKILKRVKNTILNINIDNIEPSTYEESKIIINEIELKLIDIKNVIQN